MQVKPQTYVPLLSGVVRAKPDRAAHGLAALGLQLGLEDEALGEAVQLQLQLGSLAK